MAAAQPTTRNTLPARAVCLLAVAALVCLAAAPLRAADNAVVLTVENDKFTGSDGNYTNGVGLAVSTGEMGDYDPESGIRKWHSLFSFLPAIGDDQHRNYLSWTLGQEMYTPDDITDPNPPLDDQPYAGVLYVDSMFHGRAGRWGHIWNLRLGVVGPASQADAVQKWFHDLTGAEAPLGWHTQLPNEALVNLSYTASYVWQEGSLGESAAWRLVPIGSAGIGNFFTGASLGIYAEAGWNLSDALGISSLRQGFSTATVIGAGPQDSWTISFFAGFAAYGIAHYLPLDGTLFRDSRSVDSNPFVGFVTGGVAVRYGHFVFSAAQTYFSETFETERQRADFGTVSFSWYF